MATTTELNVLCCSANIGNQIPTSLAAWIPKEGIHNDTQMDVISVGCQEAVYKLETDDKHSGADDAAAVKNHKKRTGVMDAVKDAITKNVATHLEHMIAKWLGDNYKLVKSATALEMRLFVFVHIDHHKTVGDVEMGRESTGLFKVIANKGGQAIKFKIYDTELCFVNTHLAAHSGEKHLERRNESVSEILQGIELGDRKIDLDCQFPHIFWFGDLNYRIDIDRIVEYQKDFAENWSAKEKEWLAKWKQTDSNLSEDTLKIWADKGTKFRAEWETVRQVIRDFDKSPASKAAALKKLLDADQLNDSMKHNKVFCGWKACEPTFKPTFKVLRPPDSRVSPDHPLEYLEKRIPSYCDRILFKSLPDADALIKQISFEACEGFLTSDHKPVRASFNINIDNGRQAALESVATKTTLVLEFNSMRAQLIKQEHHSDIPDTYVSLKSWPEDILIGRKLETSTKWNTHRPIWKGETINTTVKEQVVNESSSPHVLVCLRDKETVSTTSVGFCQIGLKSMQAHLKANGDAPYNFSLELVKNGLCIGVLSGSINIKRV